MWPVQVSRVAACDDTWHFDYALLLLTLHLIQFELINVPTKSYLERNDAQIQNLGQAPAFNLLRERPFDLLLPVALIILAWLISD